MRPDCAALRPLVSSRDSKSAQLHYKEKSQGYLLFLGNIEKKLIVKVPVSNSL